jgi:glycosyltransferase involved in cell wall biosynthesis
MWTRRMRNHIMPLRTGRTRCGHPQLNLLFTLTAYPPAVGGAQLLMHRLACELMSRHQVQVVTQWDERRTDWLLGTTVRAPARARAYEVDGVPVARIGLPLATRLRLAPWAAGYYAMQGPALRRIASALASQMEPSGARADLVHNCRIGREGLTAASLAVARRRNVPFVLTPVHHPRWGGWLHRHYQRLYREADAVIALTTAEGAILESLGVERRRIHVTGMGPVLTGTHDGERFRAAHGLGRDPLVLFVGQKYAYKGLAPLLRAAPRVWSSVPHARFAFVGPRTSHSRRLFGGLRDERVLELDTVSLQEKTDALAACQVLCLPSTQESFGGVCTEAWSLGRPVIVADIPALRAVVSDGIDGFVVPAEPEPLAERIATLLADPARAAAMGAEGRRKVEAQFTWPALARKTEEAYRAVGRG